MPVEQLNFFDLDIKQKPLPKVKLKIVKPKRTFTPFNFDDTCKKLKTLLALPGIKTKKNIQILHDAGKLLLELRINKPKMINDNPKELRELSFWEYSEKLFKTISSFSVYEYIRVYEIRTLLIENGFNQLPEYLTHIREIYNYTDNQILEIWEGIPPGVNLTGKIINHTRDNTAKKNKYLEKISASNTYTSYYKYLSDYYHYELNKLKYSDLLQKPANTGDYDSLKDKYNSLVRDYNIQKNRNKTLFSDNQYLKNSLESMQINFQMQQLLNKSQGKKQLSNHEILGLKNNASQADIKKAFKELSKKYHPDTNHNLLDHQLDLINKKYIEIKNAYEYLRKDKQ
jgi:hypothetical protein